VNIEIEYDPDVRALYIQFREPEGELRTEDFGRDRYVDYDAAGNVIGIELLSLSNGLDLDGLPEAGRVADAFNALKKLAVA
jgi:uncharacterized protein YuzE